jgi:hypothetical protein
LVGAGTPANAANDQTTKFSGRRLAADVGNNHSLMDDCTGWLGLAQANLDFGFWISDFGLLIPEFARLSAIESVALVPRLDISFAKESLLRRGAGGGGGGVGDRQALLPNFGFWIWVLDVGFALKTGGNVYLCPLAT